MNILDNEELIEILDTTRIESLLIQKNLSDSEDVEKKINYKRDMYRTVAKRGAILYFAILNMMRLEHMYWNSLQNIQKIYNKAIKTGSNM